MDIDHEELETPRKPVVATSAKGSAFRTPLERLKQFARTPTSSAVSTPDTERSSKTAKSAKEKNEERYGWLLNPVDKEGRSPGLLVVVTYQYLTK